MSQAVHDRVKLMYPFPCTLAHVDGLCAKGKLTNAEYLDITGKEYDGEPYIQSEAYNTLSTDLETALCEIDEANAAAHAEFEAALCELDMNGGV